MVKMKAIGGDRRTAERLKKRGEEIRAGFVPVDLEPDDEADLFKIEDDPVALAARQALKSLPDNIGGIRLKAKEEMSGPQFKTEPPDADDTVDHSPPQDHNVDLGRVDAVLRIEPV